MFLSKLKKTRVVAASLILFIAGGFISLYAEEIFVIMNAKHAGVKIDKRKVGRIFLKKMKKIDGVKVIPVDADNSEKDYSVFYKDFTRKTSAQVKKFWSKRIFTGKGKPPKAVGDSAAVVKYVSENKDAIGYVVGKQSPATGNKDIIVVYDSKIN